DLSVGERRGLPEALEPGALGAVPCGRRLVVRKDGKRGLHDIVEVVLYRVASLAPGEPPIAVRELVPDRRRDRALVTVLFKPLDDMSVGSFGNRCGDDARIEQ